MQATDSEKSSLVNTSEEALLSLPAETDSDTSPSGFPSFETKAENAYPAVGAASIIARYAFLRTMDRMEEKWQMNFAKGSGTAADDCARDFVRLYGRERLFQVAKIHFKNTERIS